jgi:hypothetical protein
VDQRTTADARGLHEKVVLVDFWIYTCINWLRTLPYLRAWHGTYSQHGLVVVGVHTPEFGIEHDRDRVERAANALRVPYPIAIDNDYAIWNAFGNQFSACRSRRDQRGHRQPGRDVRVRQAGCIPRPRC